MTSGQKFENTIRNYVPSEAIPYCLELWQKIPFSFTVTRERKSKHGDFRFRMDRQIQTITINGSLNPYQFLLTYIHEVAHLHTFESYGRRIAPHGKEWKCAFQELMEPVLNPKVFPADLLIPLRRHMRNPKATSSGDLFLMKEMSKYDKKIDSSESFLADLAEGQIFALNGRTFRKDTTRRTRALCTDISNKKKYYISLLAKVNPAS